jgi:divalent metal cation (Fe/Co/Zn/Cd) transporter
MHPVKFTLRSVRMIHATFLLTIFLYLLLLRFIQPVGKSVDQTFVVALAIVCVADVGIASFLRRQKVHASEEKLRANPEDKAALNEWRTGMILSFVFTECIALFGLVLKVLGEEWRIAGPFFAFAILLMLLWTPKLDVPAAN